MNGRVLRWAVASLSVIAATVGGAGATPARAAGASAVVRTGGSSLNIRGGISVTDPILGGLPDWSGVSVTCQAYGQLIDGTTGASPWWDQISPGRFVSDAYLSWPSGRPTLPWCGPDTAGPVAARVSAGGGVLNVRTGPGVGYGRAYAVPHGAVLTVSCQVYGQWIFGTAAQTAAWDRLNDGRYVSDAFVSWVPARPSVPWCGQEPLTVPAAGPDGFVSWAAGPARASMAQSRVPAAVTIAQAILESGWGGSALTRVDHNYFGMKCFGGPGGYALGCRDYATTECGSSGCYRTSAQFRAYRTAADSFADHGMALASLSRYSVAMRYASNPDQFAIEIHRAGYATSPGYATDLINVMRRYNLYRFS